MKTYFEKIPNRFKFLSMVTLLYVVSFIFNADFTGNAFLNFWKMFLNIAPILFFFFTLMFLINLFVKPQFMQKHLGREAGIKERIYAVLGSIIIGGPPYVLYPLFSDFRKNGMKDSLIVTFLSNRNVQPAFVPVMLYYFGMFFTVTVSFYILLFAFVNGVVAGKILDKQDLIEN